VQLPAVRLERGQPTNFLSIGGSFAPVFVRRTVAAGNYPAW
jgi:hypothetical protein